MGCTGGPITSRSALYGRFDFGADDRQGFDPEDLGLPTDLGEARDGGPPPDLGAPPVELIFGDDLGPADLGSALVFGQVCFSKVRSRVEPPSGVRVRFRAISCDGEPLGPLRDRNQDPTTPEIDVIDDQKGQPFGTGNEGESVSLLELPSDFGLYLTVALDFSTSMVSPSLCDGVNDDVDCPRNVQLEAAKTLAGALLGPGAPTPRETFVQLLAFGPSRFITTELAFTDDLTRVESTLNRLKSEAGRGSTALYDAYRVAVTSTRDAADFSDLEFSEKVVVLITDGTDEAGDTAARRAAALQLGASTSDVRKFTIGLVQANRSFDETGVRELASDPQDYFSSLNLESLNGTFLQVAERIRGLASANYQVGVCTPVEFGSPSLTISIRTDEGFSGSRQVFYATDQLTGALGDCVFAPSGDAGAGASADAG